MVCDLEVEGGHHKKVGGRVCLFEVSSSKVPQAQHRRENGDPILQVPARQSLGVLVEAKMVGFGSWTSSALQSGAGACASMASCTPSWSRHAFDRVDLVHARHCSARQPDRQRGVLPPSIPVQTHIDLVAIVRTRTGASLTLVQILYLPVDGAETGDDVVIAAAAAVVVGGIGNQGWLKQIDWPSVRDVLVQRRTC